MSEIKRIWRLVALICIAAALIAGFIAGEIHQIDLAKSEYRRGLFDGYEAGFRNSCEFVKAGFGNEVCYGVINATLRFDWSNCTEIPHDPAERYDDLVWRGVCV